MKAERSTAGPPAFCNTVLDVIQIRTEEQVGGVHARRIVAAMADHESERDLTVV
jgi:hypothetical protein